MKILRIVAAAVALLASGCALNMGLAPTDTATNRDEAGRR